MINSNFVIDSDSRFVELDLVPAPVALQSATLVIMVLR